MANPELEAIFLAQQPMLLRLLVVRLGARDDAEDALHDMWLRIDALPDRSLVQPVAYLFRMAANIATDRRVAASRRGSRDTAWIEHQPGADDHPDPERAAIAKDEWRAVQRVIACMPERMATALRLFRIERRPHREIAEELGITVSSVEKLLQRAYRMIHDRLAAIATDPVSTRRPDGNGSSGQAGRMDPSS